MKCIVCEEPNRLIMTDAETPRAAADEAIVRIRRVGVCGTDLHAYRGTQPYFTYPRVLGHELSGEITSAGVVPESMSAGDPVVVIPYISCGTCIACRNGRTNCCRSLQVQGVHSDGGLRELMPVRADRLLPAPGLSLEQMATVECLAIGAHAVRRAELRRDEFALVIGAGPIGIGLMQFAGRAGARVIAMDINPQRLKACRDSFGAEFTIDAREDAVAELESITSGDYPTAIFDATGNPQSMINAFSYVAHGGRYILVSLVNADITFNDPEFHKREISLLSSRNATREDFEQVIGALRAGEVNTDAFITHRTPIDRMVAEFDSWLDPATGVIKAMVEVG